MQNGTIPGSETGGMTAAEIMTAAPRTCSPFSSITEAALIFQDEACGAVPVIDQGKPVGILTDRDIALAVNRYPDLPNHPVSDVMTREVVTISASDDLSTLSAKFAEAKGHRLLVVDEAGQLTGIVSLSDLAAHVQSATLGRVVEQVSVPDDTKHRENHGKTQRKPAAVPPPARQAPWAWVEPRAFWSLIRETAREWSEDKVPRLGAALAFYSVLSIAPLLLIAIAVAALVFGREAASGHLFAQISGLVGKEGAEAIQEMLKNARKPQAGTIAALVGFATLLFAASGVFGQLQDALNTIWEVEPKPGRGIWGIVRDRFFSFTMVLGAGFLLLTSLLLSTAIAATVAFVGGFMPFLKPVLMLGDTLVSAVVITLLFALIYKVLPDAKVAWREVWLGALLTTALFLIGKGLIGAYLGRSSYGTAYGAAGSLVVLLVWIYYSSQILFFGAEFTKVYANRYGTRIEPAEGPQPVTGNARAQQGIPKAASPA